MAALGPLKECAAAQKLVRLVRCCCREWAPPISARFAMSPAELRRDRTWRAPSTGLDSLTKATQLSFADRSTLVCECAFRGRRPRVPVHGDQLIRSMTTRAAHGFDGAVGCNFDLSVRGFGQGSSGARASCGTHASGMTRSDRHASDGASRMGGQQATAFISSLPLPP